MPAKIEHSTDSSKYVESIDSFDTYFYVWLFEINLNCNFISSDQWLCDAVFQNFHSLNCGKFDCIRNRITRCIDIYSFDGIGNNTILLHAQYYRLLSLLIKSKNDFLYVFSIILFEMHKFHALFSSFLLNDQIKAMKWLHPMRFRVVSIGQFRVLGVRFILYIRLDKYVECKSKSILPHFTLTLPTTMKIPNAVLSEQQWNNKKPIRLFMV